MDEDIGAVALAEPSEVQPEIPDTGAPDSTAQPIADSGEPGREAPAGDEHISDQSIRAALKTIREADPRLAKAADELRKAYFSQPQWTQAFPTPREAQVAKLAWDAVGGEKGLVELQEKEQWINWVDEAAEKGDPSLVEDWAAEFPDGFRQMMPHALGKWAQMDQQGFEQALAPHFSGLLDRVQFGRYLQQAYQSLASNNPEAAKQTLSSLYDWIENYRQWAGQRTAQAANPNEEKLAQREKAITEKEEMQFREGIARESFQHHQMAVEKALRPHLSGAKISDQARSRLLKTIMDDVDASLKANPDYKRQMNAFLVRKDSRGAIAYLNGRLDTIIPGIVDAAYRDLYGAQPKAVPKAQPAAVAPPNGRQSAAQPQGDAIKVPRKPSMAEIVRKGPDWMTNYIAGRATMAAGPLKGRLITWR